MIKAIAFAALSVVFSFLMFRGIVNAQTATSSPTPTTTQNKTTTTTPGAPNTGFIR